MANQKTYIDFVSAFESGCQTGVSPLLVKKNQLANALNVSLRGGFLTHRPPYQKKTLNFQGSTATAALMSGLFQGAGYYRPDFGTESLLAQISGHLLKFTEQGEDWNVIDVSIPNDLNAATTSQVWMNQAEKWEIINDGSGVLPIFFDGTTSRRSYGDSVVLGIIASAFTPPGVGSSVELTLQSPFTGKYNVPFLLNGEYYQAITGAVGQYAAILTNLDDSPGTVWPELTQITYNPQSVGYNVAPMTMNGIYGTYSHKGYVNPGSIVSSIALVIPFQGKIGDSVFWGISSGSVGGNYDGLPVSWTVVGIGNPGSNSLYPNNPTISLQCTLLTTYFDGDQGFISLIKVVCSAGTPISVASSTNPQIVLGLTTAAFTAPNNGADVQVGLTVPYTGAAGVLVSIGIDNNGNPIFYLITAVPQTPVSNQLLVLDLTDAATASVVGGTELLSVPELPAGRMGAYGMGRQWMCLTDGISYMAGDAVGDPSGTPVLNYRDAVLKVTENVFQTNGGTFILPGSGDIITAMIFQPVLDTSLGQGALIISTPFSIWSNNAPIDRSTWASLTNPIVTESLKDNAAVGQDNTILVNSDTFFRSDVAIGSLVLARRSFMGWGNKPISNEVRKYLEFDNQSLLSFGSAVSFDNRYLCSCAPYSQAGGVSHSGLVSLNFDLMTSLREQMPPAWEGLWTGINVLKLVSGRVNGTKRDFAFTYNITTSTIELYELLAEYSESYLDNDDTPIFWAFETPALFNQDIKPLTTLSQLGDGEFYISNIKGTVTIKVYYRPDFYPCWTLWQTQTVCADTTNTNQQTGYRMRLGLGEPDVTPSEIGNDRSLTVGNFFQFRVEITGSCEWNGMQVSSNEMPQPAFAPVDIPPDCQNIQCQVPDDFTLYGLQGFPPQIGSGQTAPAPFPFFNEVVYFNFRSGCYPTFTGTLPKWITVDTINNRIVGAAGVIGGTTQADANTNAQLAINQFAEVNVESLVCAFSITGLLNTAREFHSQTLLSNDLVLAAGGNGNSGVLSSCELYTPASGGWLNTGLLNTAREYHTSTKLNDGTVLVTGGIDSGGSVLQTCELYDPVTGTWSSTGNLITGRLYHTATLLSDGTVLIAGGATASSGGPYLLSCELYDPIAKTFSGTGTMSNNREYHTATLLNTGKVLVVGGFHSLGALTVCELYDPAAGTWSNTGSITTGRFYHTSTLLQNGNVLIAAGVHTTPPNAGLLSCELYNTIAGTWSATGSLASSRFWHTATLLTNNKVIVAGGHNAPDFMSSSELYDPIAGTWANGGLLTNTRGLHTATLLSNGIVLLSGGVGETGFDVILSSCELYYG